MITELGYDILKERYSKPLDNPNGLSRFIQKMYLHKLEEKYQMSTMWNHQVEKLPDRVKGLAMATTIAPMPVGPALIGFDMPPQPFYEECLELADFILGLDGVHFHEYPYVPTSNGMVENKHFVAQQTFRGQMPTLTKKEMKFAKDEIEARFKACGYNIVHNILGISGSGKLMVACCKIPKEDLKFVGRQW